MKAGETIAIPVPRFEARTLRTAWLRRALRAAITKVVVGANGLLAAHDMARVEYQKDSPARARLFARWRRRYERLDRLPVATMNKAVEGITFSAGSVGTARFTWLDGPAFRNDGVLVYVPGGSFIVPRSPRITSLIATIARRAGVRTLICDYRLAPEHPCPAAIDDVVACLNWLVSTGIAPDRIVVAAESAGAAVALAAVQKIAAAGQGLAGMAFLSPWVDLQVGTRPTARLPRICASLYLQGRDPRDPISSPLNGQMKGLPPLLIHASRTDPFCADARALAEKAAREGCDVTLRMWSGGVHGFERFFDADGLDSLAEISAFVAERVYVAVNDAA